MSNQMPRPLQKAEKLTDWKIEPDLQLLMMDIEKAKPAQQTHISRVNTWLDNLNVTGSASIKKVTGRSGVQPKLIRKQAEWRYAALTEPFLSSDKVFSISPVSWEDKRASEQNELVLNWQFRTKLNPVQFVDQYVRTCVDEGTVAVRVGWCRVIDLRQVEAPVFEYFPVLDPQKAQALLEMSEAESAQPGSIAEQPPEVQESVRYSLETGAPHEARQRGVEQVQQEFVVKNHPTVEVVDIRNLFIDPSCGGDPEKALFMAYSFEISHAELARDKRYKNLDAVEWGHSILSEPDHATTTPQEFQFRDKGRAKVVAYEYWGYFDIEGNGQLTSFVATWIGSTLIRMEKNPYPDGKPPFVIVPYLPIKRSCYGEPDGELLVDNQKILGAVTRGMIDVMARSANGQRGMGKGMLDVVNKRRYDAGLDYEFNPNMHPSQGIVEHKFPELPASAMNMVAMQNMEAESLTGVKTFSDSGLSGASLGPTAAGARGVLDASTRREMGILRRLAQGMATIGNKIVAMNQEFLSEEEVIRVTNEEFITVKRDELHGNFDMAVAISTAEEDNAKANDLSFVLQTMGPNMDMEMNKLVMAEIARLRRMPELAHQFRNFQPQPDPVAEQLKQLELQRLTAEVAKLNSETVLNEAKAREAQSKAETSDLDYVEKETGANHAREMEKISVQAEANQDLEVTKAILHQRNGASPDGKVDDTPRQRDINEAIGFNQATRGVG